MIEFLLLTQNISKMVTLMIFEHEDDRQSQAGSLVTHLTKNQNADYYDDYDDCGGYDDFDGDTDLHPQAPLSLAGLSSQAEHSLSVNPFKLVGAPWVLSLSIVIILILCLSL